MSTIQNVRSERISAQTGRLSAAIRSVGKSFGLIFAGAVLVTSANGCLATRGWVQDQMNPLQTKLNDTDAKADQALAGLNNLHLERKLVLDSSNGPTFAFGSSALTPD